MRSSVINSIAASTATAGSPGYGLVCALQGPGLSSSATCFTANNVEMQGSGYAGASGQHTHTNVHRTAGGGVVATSFSSSTGQGPQQQESSVLHTTIGKIQPAGDLCWLQRQRREQ